MKKAIISIESFDNVIDNFQHFTERRQKEVYLMLYLYFQSIHPVFISILFILNKLLNESEFQYFYFIK